MYRLLFLLPLLGFFSTGCSPRETAVEPSAESDPSPRHVRVLWTKEPSRHAIVSWTTMAPSATNVVYYDTVSRGGDLSAYAFSKPSDRDGRVTLRAEDRSEGVPPGWYHHAEIDGLTPSTRYYVAVTSDGRVTGEVNFITAPADDRPFKLLSGGDSRMGGEKPRYAGRTPHVDRQAMNTRMARLLEEQPDILALAHGADWCTTADWRHLYWWFEDNDGLRTSDGRILPFIASRGNHDEGIGFQENFWLGDITDENSAAYFFPTALGSQVTLFTLNTEISVAGDQLEWLEEELASLRPTQRWLLAQYHRPAYPVAKDFEEHTFARVRQTWSPVFEKFNLDLALESDGHVLKRTVPIRNNAPSPDGVVYIGEGGLGVPQREPKPGLWFVEAPGFSASAHHVWLLHISQDSLVMEAIGVDGNVLDRHTLSPRS